MWIAAGVAIFLICHRLQGWCASQRQRKQQPYPQCAIPAVGHNRWRPGDSDSDSDRDPGRGAELRRALIESLKNALLAHALHRVHAGDCVIRTDYDNTLVFDGTRLPPLSGASHVAALRAYLEPPCIRSEVDRCTTMAMKHRAIARYMRNMFKSDSEVSSFLQAYLSTLPEPPIPGVG